MKINKIVILAMLSVTLVHGNIISELSTEEQGKLHKGESVTTTVEKKGAVWPEVRIYRQVKATPQEVTDLFLDYEHANTFIDNLVSAKVEKQPDTNTKDVRYTVKLPIIFSIQYLVRNHYEKTPEGFKVSWYLLEPPLAAKSAVGSLLVEPFGDVSIICYTNHVEPATRLIAGLKGHAIKEATKTVAAITKEAEKRHNN